MIYLAIAALFGLIFGSFITLAAHRLPKEEDIILKRSECPKCKHTLHIPDLIPLFSWVIQQGKCRYCNQSISLRYPLIEIITASIFVVTIWLAGPTIIAIILCGIWVCLSILIITDMDKYIIPDITQLTLFILVIIYGSLTLIPWSKMMIMGCIGLGLGLLLHYGCIWIKKQDGLGWGDVKLLAISSIVIPMHDYAYYLLLAGSLGIIIGLIWRALGKGKLFPFGPALALALYTIVLVPYFNL